MAVQLNQDNSDRMSEEAQQNSLSVFEEQQAVPEAQYRLVAAGVAVPEAGLAVDLDPFVSIKA